MEESRTAEDHMYVVEGMQFDRGYISPYFVTDPERMVRCLGPLAGLQVLGRSARMQSCRQSAEDHMYVWAGCAGMVCLDAELQVVVGPGRGQGTAHRCMANGQPLRLNCGLLMAACAADLWPA